MSEANDLTEMLELMCQTRAPVAIRNHDGECLMKRMDSGSQTDGTRRGAPVLEFRDAVPTKCLRPAKEKWRLSFAAVRAEHGATRKPECLRLRSPAYAMRAREAAKADDNFSTMTDMSSNDQGKRRRAFAPSSDRRERF